MLKCMEVVRSLNKIQIAERGMIEFPKTSDIENSVWRNNSDFYENGVQKFRQMVLAIQNCHPVEQWSLVGEGRQVGRRNKQDCDGQKGERGKKKGGPDV